MNTTADTSLTEFVVTLMHSRFPSPGGRHDRLSTHTHRVGKTMLARSISMIGSMIVTCVVLWVLLASYSTTLGAAEVGDEAEDAVKAAATALRDSGKFPWYDAQADDVSSAENDGRQALRPVNLKPYQEPHHADAQWELPEYQGPQTNFDFSFFGDIMQFLGWLLLAALIAGLVYFFLIAYLRREFAAASRDDTVGQQAVITDSHRIENLPIQLRETKRDFLTMAQELYQAGRYDEAIIYLFSYQLLRLDRAHLIRLTRGKTNRQYLYELGKRTDVRRMVTHTIQCFEQVFFGHHSLDKQSFDHCWLSLDDFHRLLEQETK